MRSNNQCGGHPCQHHHNPCHREDGHVAFVERRRDDDLDHEHGDRGQNLTDTLDDGVEQPAEIGRREAQNDTNQRPSGTGQDTDQCGLPQASDHGCVHVTAEEIAAERQLARPVFDGEIEQSRWLLGANRQREGMLGVNDEQSGQGEQNQK